MIKKSFCLILSAMVFVLMLTSCGDSESPDKKEEQSKIKISSDNLKVEVSFGSELRGSFEDNGPDIDKYYHAVRPSISDKAFRPVTTKDGVNFSGGANKAYFESEMYCISTKEMWVHLTSEEGVTVECPDSPELAKILRVSFQCGDETATYEPNKGEAATELKTFDLPEGTMTYNNDNRLFRLEKLTPQKLTVRIWIEKNDPDLNDSIKDAECIINLALVGCDENGNPIA